MSIDPELLMAYADGELGPIEARRVERAIAADPALATQVARHRALAARLRDGFAPVAAEPVPDAVAAMLRESAKVVPLAPRPRRAFPVGWAGAIAASLVVGLFAGQMIPRTSGDAIALADGGAMVRGPVAEALATQLASIQAPDAAVRIGVTFRDAGGALCRSFERGAVGGIACAAGRDWRLTRLYGGTAAQGTAYRQAGSANAAMMADVQTMAAGDPLDADQERRALETLRRPD